jgi:Tol biopolymer transport system component
MSRAVLRLAIMALLLAAFGGLSLAQFGKNKITYEKFEWHVYESPHFNVHYYPSVEPFLEEVVSHAESAYLKLSSDLDHELKFRVPLVIYKTHGEFLQTNISLSELPEGVGAFAEPVQYRMVLPIDDPPDKLYKLIAHELTHIFEYSLFYEGYLGRALRSRPPTWIMEGLASYLAQDEDNLDRMAIRDAVVNNILPPIQALNVVTFLTYRYGNAIFDYIEKEHGLEGLRSFLFEFKKVLLTGNVGRAIKEAFGYDMEEFNRRFNRYLRQKYFPVLLEKKSPDEYGTEISLRRGAGITFSPSLSPSGQLVAALAAPKVELDLVVISAEDGSLVKNLTKGWTNDYRNLATQAFSGRRDISWSPASDQVAVFARKENKWPLLIFDGLTGKRQKEIILPDIFQCSSPAYSPDGRKIAFEGNRNGIVDIFEYNLDTREIRNLTQDDFYDANPWYADDGKTLLYNRRIGEYWKIFQVDLTDASKKTQITFGTYSDIQPSYSRDGKQIYFSSDRGPYGVFNIHSLDLETGALIMYTDLVGGAFAPTEMAERDGESQLVFTAYYEGSFRLYRMTLTDPVETLEADERLAAVEVAEAEPFKPDLELSVDEEAKRRYKIKWDIEAPSLTIGLSDDGTLLSNIGIQFTDLLGNHRAFIRAATVSDFVSYELSYLNVKNRYTWGASVFDYRDFFFTSTGEKQEYRYTGGSVSINYPLSRYYRVGTTLGVQDSAQEQLVGVNPDRSPRYAKVEDTMGRIEVELVGDTTRYQSFGPFQGKRFALRALYGPHISGDFPGDLVMWSADFRAYKQVTRRSLLAWRVSGVLNTGEREPTFGSGGLNQIRGYEFREFVGSSVAWTNLEFRFPLVDEMRFPIFALTQIRGFFFLDAGATWFQDDAWYDPETRLIRVDVATQQVIPFKFWDSENNHLQDGRGSYGAGFQFFFIGGLQFNWVWGRQLDHTQYVYFEPDGQPLLTPVPTSVDGESFGQFYIAFDF